MTVYVCNTCHPETICTHVGAGIPKACTEGGDEIDGGLCDWQEVDEDGGL